MQVEYKKKFLKELANLPKSERERIEAFVFEVVPDSKDFFELHMFDQMKGYSAYYKARFGDYRVGIHYAEGKLIFERVLHRKEIYRYFP